MSVKSIYDADNTLLCEVEGEIECVRYYSYHEDGWSIKTIIHEDEDKDDKVTVHYDKKKREIKREFNKSGLPIVGYTYYDEYDRVVREKTDYLQKTAQYKFRFHEKTYTYGNSKKYSKLIKTTETKYS